jgi:hypothetical protein
MRSSHKPFLLLLIFSLCYASPVLAQTGVTDTTIGVSSDTIVSSSIVGTMDTTNTVEGADETVPETPVVYNTATPTDAQWNTVTSDNAYTYRNKKEYVDEKEVDEKPSRLMLMLENFFRFLQSGTGKILLWSALALIIGYIVCRIILGQGSGLFGKRDYAGAEETTGNVTEESLLENNWDELLKAAIAAGDTRLSIRYSYMRLLQLLQERSLIAYRPDKTNFQYYRELADSPYRQSFRDLSRQYEYAWYGNYLPEKAVLDHYLQEFNNIRKSLATS